MLIICQVKGEWKTKDIKLKLYQNYLVKLTSKFEEVEFTQMSRDKNQFADGLATLTSMVQIVAREKIYPIDIKFRNYQAHCFPLIVTDGKPWYNDIKRFIQHQKYPQEASKADKETLRRMAANFYLDGEILYKRLFDGTLLKCLDENKIRQALKEVHKEICATNANGHKMTKQMKRFEYFWFSMEKDYVTYLKMS